MRGKEKQRIPIEKIILGTILTVGVMGVALMAPNALQMFKMFGIDKKKYPKDYINRAIGRLKNKGYIKFEKTPKGTFVRLTKKGKEKLKEYQDKKIALKKPRRWDKKWRVVIFDIRENKRNLRDKIRRELVSIGFVRLQNSVWVFPYECEELLIMLKSNFKLEKEVLYLRVDSIENDRWLTKFFNLK